jgi:hypothetical protein
MMILLKEGVGMWVLVVEYVRPGCFRKEKEDEEMFMSGGG